MLDMSTTPLPAPGSVLDGADMRVQEIIHGHRIIPEQEPFMVVLEALAVCASKPLGSVVPRDGAHEAFEYNLPHRQEDALPPVPGSATREDREGRHHPR